MKLYLTNTYFKNMQYFYKDDLYHVTAELTELTKNLLEKEGIPYEPGTLPLHIASKMSCHEDNNTYLTQHGYAPYWYRISETTTDMKLLRDNLDSINWASLSANPNALELLQENIDKIYWYELSKNPGAIPIIETNMDKVNIGELCLNPNAVHLFERFPVEMLDFYNIASNINATWLVIKNIDYISNCPDQFATICGILASIPTQEAVDFITENMWRGKINNNVWSLYLNGQPHSHLIWTSLSKNPYAVPFLEKHTEYINWYHLYSNPNALHLIEEHCKGNHPTTNFRSLVQHNPNAGKLVTDLVHKLGDKFTV